jgi:hypothetical protein
MSDRGIGKKDRARILSASGNFCWCIPLIGAVQASLSDARTWINLMLPGVIRRGNGLDAPNYGMVISGKDVISTPSPRMSRVVANDNDPFEGEFWKQVGTEKQEP